MKKLLVIAAVIASVVSARAQGTVDFKNSSPISQPVFDVDGTTKLNSAFMAQLYWSATPTGTYAAVSDPAVSFRDAAGAGFWNPGADSSRTVGVAAGSNVSLIVRAWKATDGASYEAAAAKALVSSATYGSSLPITIATGGSGVPPSLPASLTGFTSFSVKFVQAPEPSVIALGALGAAALLIRRRK